MVLDEVDRLRNADKENFGQVIAVLNVGFEQARLSKGRSEGARPLK